jgi:acyl-coenzyme A thioesterase PaaI-like protein
VDHHLGGLTAMLAPSEVDAFVAQVYPSAARAFRCDAIGERSAVARWLHDPAELRPGDLVSGPTQFAAADLALWFLAFSVVGLRSMAVTADLQITFLRPAAGGPDLLARSELLRAGRSRIVGRVLLWMDGDAERPVAHATGSYALLVS